MADARRAKAPVVDCPTCGRKVEFVASNRWRPFCSERCRGIDLGAWASGSYVIAGAPLQDLPDDAELPAPERED